MESEVMTSYTTAAYTVTAYATTTDKQNFDEYYGDIEKQAMLQNDYISASFPSSDIFISLLQNIGLGGTRNFIVFTEEHMELYSDANSIKLQHYVRLSPTNYTFCPNLDQEEREKIRIILECQFSAIKNSLVKNKKTSIVFEKKVDSSEIEIFQMLNNKKENSFALRCAPRSSIPSMPSLDIDTKPSYVENVKTFADACSNILMASNGKSSAKSAKSLMTRMETVSVYIHRSGLGMYMSSYSPISCIYKYKELGSITRDDHFSCVPSNKYVTYLPKNQALFSSYKINSKSLACCTKIDSVCGNKDDELEIRCSDSYIRIDVNLANKIGCHTVFFT